MMVGVLNERKRELEWECNKKIERYAPKIKIEGIELPAFSRFECEKCSWKNYCTTQARHEEVENLILTVKKERKKYKYEGQGTKRPKLCPYCGSKDIGEIAIHGEIIRCNGYKSEIKIEEVHVFPE